MTYLTIADLTARLTGITDPTGTHPDGLPVLAPGTPLATLPAIIVQPDDDRLEQTKLVRTGVDVLVAVPRSSQVEQFPHLVTIERAVLDRLAGSSFTYGDRFGFEVGGPPDDPPYMGYRIPVSFIGYGLCPDRTPTVAELERTEADPPDPDPDPESE